MADEVAAQAEEMEGNILEDIEEGVVEEVQQWQMVSIFQRSMGPSRTRNGPLSLVRTGAMSIMRNVSTGATRMDLLGKSMQRRLLLPSQSPTDPLSLLIKLHLTTTMEELDEPLALVAVPIMAGDAEEDEDVLDIDLTLLDACH